MAGNNYQIIRSLHKNDRHEIFLARFGDREVVIKKSIPNQDQKSAASKLGNEYSILKELDHKSVPQVYELLQESGSIVLIEEYFEGINLKEKLFKGRISIEKALDISNQLAGILQYLHDHGVIHRDIKPGNIIITPKNEVKLIDFGFSTAIESGTDEFPNIDKIEGSLTYISPEQTGRTAYKVIYTSDFYSLGIVLYEMLAGKPPFDSVDPLEVIHFHLSRKPIPIRTILPEIPREIEQILMKLLEKSPDDRYHSAAGLKHDLEVLLKRLNKDGYLSEFKAGQQDLIKKYIQTQKLYGRESEKNELLGYYRDLPHIKSMLVLVAGYSGVGKSVLIRHVKFPIIQSGGTFIAGKFDQFKKDIPYYGFIEAIIEFIRNLLSEPEEKITSWRLRIINVLGDNAGLITEVLPQLSKIIGIQPEVTKLQPAEQEARFDKVILDFIYSFSSPENPLVIFLDDLQWADLSSLSLVRRIVENPRQENIMILGAYRDNEVEKGHPLMITLKQIGDSRNQVKHLNLKALDKETTSRIVADSFTMNKDQAAELGSQVFNKTKGNPFFIHSFLKSLYDKHIVRFDNQQEWVWNKEEVDKLGYTENVIELMTEGIIMLPFKTQEMLKYSAILGNTFSLHELSDISSLPVTDVFSILKPALQEGYLSSAGNSHKIMLLSTISSNFDSGQKLSENELQFAFSHDKVQQAAYSLIPKSELSQLHLQIGRLLIKKRDPSRLSEDVFELLNHFSIAIDLIEDTHEKKQIAELALIAGRRAKDSNSYSFGVHFLTIAMDLIGSKRWDDNYDLTYQVLFELGECEYLNNNPSKAEKYFTELLGYSRTRFEKLKVYYAHSSLYLKMGNTQESLRLGLEAARLYNIRFPSGKIAITLATMAALAKHLFLFSFRFKDPASLFRRQECTDVEIVALNKFLIDLATSAYQQDRNLMMLVIFQIIKSFLKDGFTDASGYGFSGFSVVVLSALKMQKRGFRLWELTKRLHQRTLSPIIKWRLGFTVISFSNPWMTTFRESFDKMLELIKACYINGDHIWAIYSIALYIRFRFMAGANLEEISVSSEEHIALLKDNQGGLDFFQPFFQLVKALTGKTKNGSWEDENFSIEETLQRLSAEGNKTKLAYFHTAYCSCLYYSGRYRQAVEESQIVAGYSDNYPGDILEAWNSFYTALSISAAYDELSSAERKKFKRIFRSHLRHMKLYSDGNQENFLQHYLLLKAEYSAINGEFESSLRSYEQAIQKAQSNQIAYVEAIANERAALFCAKNKMSRQFSFYMKAAYEAYKTWGAVAKCSQLEKNWPDIFSNTDQKYQNPNTADPSSAISSGISTLDISTVIKVSQSIASQVKYEELLEKLMNITIENAGAQRACLFLAKEGSLYAVAEGFSGKEVTHLRPSVPLSGTELVPVSFVNYCWRSGESIVTENATANEQYSGDPYVIRNKTLSMSCVLISAQGRMIGVLYLENNMIQGAISKNRIRILEMLSGQIGISIENSILYENLEEKVMERTHEIHKQKAQIEEEKEKSDALLLNILPRRTAEELKNTGNSIARSYENVTVMFCDIVGFTAIAERLEAQELVQELHEFFSGVDDIVAKYGIDKIKTIGDAYLCANGFEEYDKETSAIKMLSAASDILDFLENLNKDKEAGSKNEFQVRIGVHSGPVTAGVVGKAKFAYDIWGDTVNTAARMETSGESGRINISGGTYALVKDVFDCEYRGKVEAKNKGHIEMYFVNKSK